MAQYTSEPNKYARGRGAISPTVHWNKISEILNRNKIDCVNKWHYVNGSKVYRSMKRGPFTVDEDSTIINTVKHWEHKGNQNRIYIYTCCTDSFTSFHNHGVVFL